MLKICVIGAGVVGMSSAVQIAEKFKGNVEVTVVTDQVTPNTTVSCHKPLIFKRS